MDWGRLLRHLATGSRVVARCFPASALRAIESAISEGEARHGAELRFAVEAALDLGAIVRGVSPRERAIEVFSELRMWDTEQNTGVLIYLLIADRDVEIVADRGVAHRVADTEWEVICRQMETELRSRHYEGGALAGIRAASDLLARHVPATGRAGGGEQPNEPALI